MKVLSLIIPAYNSGRFLDKCIGSMVACPDRDRLDIIVVNDGSQDDTARIAGGYCDRYPGIVRLISQENKGHGGALNTGCDAAVGKYLKVIDADDWVDTQALTAFVQVLEGCESDVVLTHYLTHNIATGEVKKWKHYPPQMDRDYTFAEIMAQWKNFDRSLTFHGITYRRDFYRQRGIRLSEKVFYEDHEFATFPCCYARSLRPVDLYVYDYRIGDVEQSVSEENQLKRIGHTQTVLERFAEEYRKLALPQEDPGRAYVARKAQGLLLSYLTTAMLVEKDRKKGRTQAADMMAFFRERLPQAYAMARKHYLAYLLMNRLHISKAAFDRMLHSGVYNRLRGNHDFS